MGALGIQINLTKIDRYFIRTIARTTTNIQSTSKKDVTEGTGIGLAIGVGLGVVSGMLMDNLGLGIALGAGFGLLFAFTIPSTRKRKSSSQ